MQHARAESVLGDFRGASLAYAGNTHRFDTEQGKYWVTTDGPDGKPRRFQVLYTFGLEPLQQYLVEAPGGRLQVLSSDSQDGTTYTVHVLTYRVLRASLDLVSTTTQQAKQGDALVEASYQPDCGSVGG